jgi:hypothetical protein
MNVYINLFYINIFNYISVENAKMIKITVLPAEKVEILYLIVNVQKESGMTTKTPKNINK